MAQLSFMTISSRSVSSRRLILGSARSTYFVFAATLNAFASFILASEPTKRSAKDRTAPRQAMGAEKPKELAEQEVDRRARRRRKRRGTVISWIGKRLRQYRGPTTGRRRYSFSPVLDGLRLASWECVSPTSAYLSNVLDGG